MCHSRSLIFSGLFLFLILCVVLLLRSEYSLLLPECHPHWNEYEVRGNSMSPLLQSGDLIRVDMNYYECRDPQVGEVVVLSHPHREAPLVKMIYALDGDELAFTSLEQHDTYHLKINGAIAKATGRPFVFMAEDIPKIQAYIDAYAGVVPTGYALILGLNPAGSLDSTEYGLYHIKSFLGRVDIEP